MSLYIYIYIYICACVCVCVRVCIYIYIYIMNHNKTLISRVKLMSSSATIFLNEIKNMKQTLINSGLTNHFLDTKIKHFFNKTEQHIIDNTLNHKQSINFFYQNHFHNNYKISEQE